MDIQRTILLISIAVVSYLLVLAWNEDYGQPAAPPVQTVAETALKPTAAPPDLNTELDTPESLAATETEPQSLSGQSTGTGDGELIKVRTRLLNVSIDPVGGNIVHAELPGYNRSLNSEDSLVILDNGTERYYVAQSGMIGRNGFDSAKNGPPPVYTVEKTRYDHTDSDKPLQIDLHHQTADGIQVIKRFTFNPEKTVDGQAVPTDYLIDVRYLLSNQSENIWRANFSGKILRDASEDPSQQTSMGMRSYLGFILSTPEKPYKKIDFGDIEKEPIKQAVQGGWLAFLQHYFISAWIPDSETVNTYQTRSLGGTYLGGFVSPEMTLAPGESGEAGASFFVGPKVFEHLQPAAPNLELTVDYGWLWFIAKPLFSLLNFIFGYVGNWGIAIIVLTIIVKGLFYPLSAASYRSMANMRRVGPKLKELKDQYGDDRQRMSQAMMELYKKEKINPLGGCLPILVQMPVFIALYWVLLESVQLRHSPFYFWIQDMSVKDPYFILPILMGVTMFVQTSLNPAPPDPTQARVMKMMPVIFTFFFLWFPAGLVLYWLVNNILSILQQWYINRSIEKGAAATAQSRS